MPATTLCVGPHAAVQVQDPRGTPRLLGTTRPFMGQATESLVLEVRYGPLPSTAGLQLVVDSGGPWRVFRAGPRHVFELLSGPERRPYQVAAIDFAENHGLLHLPAGTDAPPFEYPLSQLVFGKLLADHGAVIVHAAGVLHRGVGLLLPGSSGAGKSTLARLFHERGACVVNDDRVAVARDGPSISGTPWSGTADLALARTGPLHGIVFLRHGGRNALHELPRTAAARQLLALCVQPYWHEEAAEAGIDTAVSLAGRLPAYELAFVPGEAAVDLMLREFVCGNR